MSNNSKLLDYNTVIKSNSPSALKKTNRLTKEIHSEDIEGKSVEVPKKTIRDTFYGRINVSVKTMDLVITVLIIALLASIIIGLTI